MDILRDIWSDTAGKVFLITFFSYLFGYMAYGGYISAFFNQRGSVPFGFVDFSIADLISILPITIITIISLLPKIITSTLKALSIHLLLPSMVGFIIRFAFNDPINLLLLKNPSLTIVSPLGFVLWLFGSILFFWKSKFVHSLLSIVFELVGSILVFCSIPIPGKEFPNFIEPFAQIRQTTIDILTLFIILEIIILTYILGNTIAKNAIRKNWMTHIERIVFNRPVSKDCIRNEHFIDLSPSHPASQKHWFFQKKLAVSAEPEIYEWPPSPERNFYLIATFQKFLLIYCLDKNSGKNQTITLNRENILSIELASK